MKQTRLINHGDGHTDIETLFGDVWAVTKCNLEVAMYNGWTESQAQTNARAARIIAYRQQLEIRDAMVAEVAPMLGVLRSAVAGTFTTDDDGESKLLNDWQCEETARVTYNYLDALEDAENSRDWANQVSELRGGG